MRKEKLKVNSRNILYILDALLEFKINVFVIHAVFSGSEYLYTVSLSFLSVESYFQNKCLGVITGKSIKMASIRKDHQAWLS